MAQFTLEQFGEQIKQKHPQYANVDNIDLGKRVLEKYPQYQRAIKQESAESPTKGFGERVGERFKEQTTALSDVYNKAGEQYQKGGFLNKAGATLGALSQTIGRGATFAGNILEEAATSAFRALPDAIESPIRDIGKQTIETKAGQAVVGGLSKGLQVAQDLEKEHPIIGGVVRTGLGATELAGAIKGGISLKQNIEKGIDLASETGKNISSFVKNKSVSDLGKDLAETALQKSPSIIQEKLQPALARRSTNLKAKQLEREAVKASSPIVRSSYENGLDLADANRVKNIIETTPALKPKIVEMLSEAKKVTKGLDAEPEKIIGSEALSKFNKIDVARQEAGKTLTEYAKNIPAEKLQGTNIALLNRLKSVRGLEGVKMFLTKEGWSLDFSKTAISRNKSAQKQLIKDFRDAVKRDAQGKHLLRQELFNDLNLRDATKVKKISTIEDNATEAIRQGLSDVLDVANDQYKQLNQQYRLLENSLKSTRRVLGKTIDASDDLKSAKLAQVIRRTTSVANPEARVMLEDLQKAFQLLGITDDIDLVQLQQILNIIDRYFPISKGTGFQKQIQTATEKALPLSGRGIIGKALEKGGEALIGPTGITDATKQKALEDLINSLIKQ